MVVRSHNLPGYTLKVALSPPHLDDAASDSRLARIGTAPVPQISATWHTELELNGFETATIAELPTQQTQIDMGLVQQEALDTCEEDGQIERRHVEGHE